MWAVFRNNGYEYNAFCTSYEHRPFRFVGCRGSMESWIKTKEGREFLQWMRREGRKWWDEVVWWKSRINCNCGGSSKDLGELSTNKRHLLWVCAYLCIIAYIAWISTRKSQIARHGIYLNASHSRIGHITMLERIKCNLIWIRINNTCGQLSVTQEKSWLRAA